MKLKKLAENNLLVAILATIFLSLSTIFFFSQHHSNYNGHRNEVDGYWYVQMKGFPVTYAGFSIDNQEVPWYFLKIRNVDNAWSKNSWGTAWVNNPDNAGKGKMYTYFDLRLAIPVFLGLLIIFGCLLIAPNIIIKNKKAKKILLFISYVLLIIGVLDTIFFYNFSVPWN